MLKNGTTHIPIIYAIVNQPNKQDRKIVKVIFVIEASALFPAGEFIQELTQEHITNAPSNFQNYSVSIICINDY